MREKDELKISRLLSGMEGKGEATFPWGSVQVEIKHINYSAGGEGCPDSLLILRLELPILGKRVIIQAPILIEAEKAGIGAAMTDLRKFCERSMKGTLDGGTNSFLEIPMIVATEKPTRTQKVERKNLNATFRIIDVPI